MRYPLALVESLTAQVERGQADPTLLADVLNLSVDDVFDTVDLPADEDDEAIAARLLQTNTQFPSTPELEAWIVRNTAS